MSPRPSCHIRMEASRISPPLLWQYFNSKQQSIYLNVSISVTNPVARYHLFKALGLGSRLDAAVAANRPLAFSCLHLNQYLPPLSMRIVDVYPVIDILFHVSPLACATRPPWPFPATASSAATRCTWNMFSAALIFPLDSDLASACFRAHVDDNIGRPALVGCDEALCKCGDGALIANIDPIFNCVRLFSILFFYHFYPPFFFSLFSLFLCVFFRVIHVFIHYYFFSFKWRIFASTLLENA